jgi:hypothetical protein
MAQLQYRDKLGWDEGLADDFGFSHLLLAVVHTV